MPRGFPLQDYGPGMSELFRDLQIEQEERAARRENNPNRRCAHGKLFTESCEGCGYIHPRDR